MDRWFLFLTLSVMVTFLAACGRKEPAPSVPAKAVSQFEPASLARGEQIFSERCAQCHGPEGQGHPDWQRPSDGIFAAAPPLNGTGNDWKKSRAELAAVIKSGVRRKADKAIIMPSMQGKLSERELDDLLNWMQSLWPAEVYETWNKAQHAAASPKR